MFKKNVIIFLIISTVIGISINCATTSGGFKNPKFINKNITKIGVVNFSGPENLANAVTDNFTIELFKLGKFDVFERNQINHILKEQGLSISGVTDETARKKLGKLANIEALFLGMVSAYGGSFGTTDVNLSVRLIDIETGALIYACSAKSDYALVAVGTLGESINVVVNAIIKDINKNFN